MRQGYVVRRLICALLVAALACSLPPSTASPSVTTSGDLSTPSFRSPLATVSGAPTALATAAVRCVAPTTATAEQFVRAFLAFAERGDEAALADCLAAGATREISSAAWARTGGAERVESVADQPWANAHEVVRVQAWLRNGSVVSWPPGETRWLQAVATERGWRLESITATHPRPSEDEIWQIVSRQLPTNILVLRPVWLPDDFMPRLAYLWGTNTNGAPSYWLDYSSTLSGRIIAFHRGGGNSAPPTSTEHLGFRGADATLSTTASWPGIQLTWNEDGYTYQIQMSKGTREELLRIANGLIGVRSTGP